MFSSSQNADIAIIYNKSNHFGLQKDAELLKSVLSSKANVRFVDPLEIPSPAHINIHLEVPIYSFVPWGTYNIFIMNPEWYVKAWDPYLKHFDAVITKEDLGLNAVVLPWTIIPFPKQDHTKINEFLYLLGGSKNKRNFAKILLPLWKSS